MGQQQLLLVILVTILVGIATVVAINVFGTAAEQANRDAIRQDLIQAAAAAQAIWARPTALGGVSGDFSSDPPTDAAFARLMGIPGSVDGLVITNENATYTIVRQTNDIEITAVPTSYYNDLVLDIERNTGASGPDDDAWNISITDGSDDPVFLSGAGSD